MAVRTLVSGLKYAGARVFTIFEFSGGLSAFEMCESGVRREVAVSAPGQNLPHRHRVIGARFTPREIHERPPRRLPRFAPGEQLGTRRRPWRRLSSGIFLALCRVLRRLDDCGRERVCDGRPRIQTSGVARSCVVKQPSDQAKAPAASRGFTFFRQETMAVSLRFRAPSVSASR